MVRFPRMAQRVLAIGMLAAVIAAAWTGVAEPLMEEVAQGQARKAQLLELLARYSQAAAVRPAQEARRNGLLEKEKKLVGIVVGATAEIAAAKLQGEFRNMIRRNGGRVRIEQNLPATKMSEFDRLEFRYEFSMPMNSLLNLLHQIESFVPYLIIDSIQIQAPEHQGPNVANGKGATLSIRWRVVAYRRAARET